MGNNEYTNIRNTDRTMAVKYSPKTISNIIKSQEEYFNVLKWTSMLSDELYEKSLQNDRGLLYPTTNPTLTLPIVDSRSFSKIRILSENKVVEVSFADGRKIKTICDDESEFSLEFALYLSLAKRLYSDKYTSEGVWKKAQDLKYEKYFVKLVQDGLKMYKKEQKEKEEAEKRAEEERQIIERKKAKKIAYKKRREERRKADQVDVIVQAMKIVNETK